MPLSDPPVDILPGGGLLIGDRRITDASGGEHEHVYAATGRATRRVPLGGAREIGDAVAAARRALPAWRAMPPPRRRALLLRLSELVLARETALATLQTIETAVPARMTAPLPAYAADYFAYNAGWADKIGGEVVPTWPRPAFDYTLDEPYGVVAAIIPWNAPLAALGQVVGPALAAGNTVVLKPPELAPFTSIAVGELALEAGFPPGTLNVVPGGPEAGDALVRHPGVDKVHFTGSGATARKVLSAAGEHLTPVALELGGKSAVLAFPDADLMAVAEQAIGAAIVLSGQGCTNGTRVIAHASVQESLLRLAKGLLKRVKVGDPFDAATMMGPVVSRGACERILTTIDRAVAAGDGRLVYGGRRLDGDLAGGYFVAPTLFAGVSPGSPLAQEEIFGPVVSFMTFDTDAEAIELANATRYGLAAYVYTADLRRAQRVAQALAAGVVWINGFDAASPSMPFGGTKESGYGRLGGRAGIREFTRPKNVWMPV